MQNAISPNLRQGVVAIPVIAAAMRFEEAPLSAAGIFWITWPTSAVKSSFFDAMAQACCPEPEARETLACGETTGPIAHPRPTSRRALEGRENGTNATRRPGSSRAPSGARRCAWIDDLNPGGFITDYLLASLRLVAAAPHEERVFK